MNRKNSFYVVQVFHQFRHALAGYAMTEADLWQAVNLEINKKDHVSDDLTKVLQYRLDQIEKIYHTLGEMIDKTYPRPFLYIKCTTIEAAYRMHRGDSKDEYYAGPFNYRERLLIKLMREVLITKRNSMKYVTRYIEAPTHMDPILWRAELAELFNIEIPVGKLGFFQKVKNIFKKCFSFCFN